MNLVNATKLAAGCTTATDKAGREWLVVVAKGTYGFPGGPGEPPMLLGEQVPLTMTDVFAGEPGISALKYEIDFAPRKPRCDVLLNGSCHAPAGAPAVRVDVALQVGSMTKAFRVVGERTFVAGVMSSKPSSPRAFTVMPITYERAYGGISRSKSDPTNETYYPLNHVGVGYHPNARDEDLEGMALPNTEELRNPVTSTSGDYKPMAFGPLGRAWKQRLRWAGTYDQQWLADQFPFLPEDFDERYFQSAPEDQQIDYLQGGEEIRLDNLTPEGRTVFRLPTNLTLPIVFAVRDRGLVEVLAVVDTLLIEPDRSRLMISWRAALVLRRNVREVTEIVVGRSAGRVAHEERARRKRRFASLGEMVEWSREWRRARGLESRPG